MNEQRFLNACQLRDEGKLSEARNEFIQLAESARDPLDKAGALLYAADTLELLGQQEGAMAQLNAARTLVEVYLTSNPVRDEKVSALELFLDYEDANLFWLSGKNPEAALNRFDAAIKKHKLVPSLSKGSPTSMDLHAQDYYEAIQIRRAFVLADLGRWKEALPILEGVKSPKEYKEGVAFYLGHCYSSAHDLHTAEEKLTEALKLGLPNQLEYCAHCELGTVYYELGDYARAKQEFEKGAETANSNYIRRSQIWRWLEVTCRALDLRAEAEQYARMQNPS